jgi:hypothetical protein
MTGKPTPEEAVMLYVVVIEESGQWNIKVVTFDQDEAYRLAEEAGGLVATMPIEKSWGPQPGTPATAPVS